MERDCYRCGQPIDDNLAFCSRCGAPQIKVSRASEQPSPEPDSASPDSPPPAPVSADGVPALAPGIEWRQFLFLVLPLAVLTGVVTAILPPLGFFIVLPATIILSISRYQRRLAHPLRGGHGARMGAMTAVLSFSVFLVAVSLLWRTYRPLIINKIQETASQNPDLQTQQTLQWFASPEGLPVFLVMFLGMILVVFLLVGLASGALAARMGRNQPRL